MHCVNCSIFFWSFLKQPWLSAEDKARLLEWKGRVDLAMYASRRAPKPYTDDIERYTVTRITPTERSSRWQEIFARVSKDPEDGHASKILRTLAVGEKMCRNFEGRNQLAMSEYMWLAIASMGKPLISLHRSQLTVSAVIDSVEGQEKRWVRSDGFEQAWTDVENRA